ncbi:MAG TPA: OstA-like protein [Candidatus Kapabacteria bacterium]|nr:OstA-like protein [Candidatus Kapabacteria bacterium]
MGRLFYFTFYGFGFALLLSVSSYAQQKKDPVHVTADSLSNSAKNGEPVTKLIGRVNFFQGSIFGSADRAEQHPMKNFVELFGNVNIRQDTLSLVAPHVTYDGNSGISHADGHIQFSDRNDHITSDSGTYDLNSNIARFFSNVRAVQSGTTLTSDTLIYIRSTQTMTAIGNVFVVSDSGTIRCDTLVDARSIGERTATGNVNLKNDSLIVFCNYLYESKPQKLLLTTGNVQAYSIPNRTMQFGDTIIRNTATGHSFVPSRPLLEIIDTTTTFDSIKNENVTTFDTLFIKSRSMEAIPGDSSRFIAIDSVILMRSNFEGKCGKLIYYKEQGVMSMFRDKRQHVWYDSTEINGDSVVMYEKNNKPQNIVAFGHAFATTPYTDSAGTKNRMSQLSSQSMILTIAHDTVRSLLAVDNALSIYFMSSEGKPNGLNRSSGDSLRIDFAHNNPERIVVLSGVEGEYWPDKYIGQRGAAFRLGNYERYYETLHPRREDFFPAWEPKNIILSAQ